MSTDTDPMTLMLNDSAYDELIKEAEIDKRVGDHRALVQNIVKDHWPEQYGGHARTKVNFVLLTANNAKADWTFSPPPPPEEVKAKKATWEPGKLKAIASSVAVLRQIIKHYGVTIDAEGYPSISVGDEFNVKTAKTRREADGSGGFIRVIAFLEKDRPVGEEATKAASGGSRPDF